MEPQRTIEDRASEVHELPFDLVTDTNFFLETFSIADLMAEGYRLGDPPPVDPMTDPLFRHRLGRSYHALALGVEIHRRQLTTFSLGTEALEAIRRQVPHETHEDTAQPDYHYVIHLTNLVKDRILSGWQDTATRGLSDDLKNKERDQLYLEVARRSNRPLVTNEGNTYRGINDSKKGLRRDALAAGVDVVAPVELNARWRVDTDENWCWLLGEIDRLGGEYLEAFSPSWRRELMRKSLFDLWQILQVVAANGKEAAVPLTTPEVT